MADSSELRAMNIHNDECKYCILCNGEPKYGDKYFVRTDVKSIVTDHLKKIPTHLQHLFDFLPSKSSSYSLKKPFCCRCCKKLLEKRQRTADNLETVENEIRRTGGSASRRLSFNEIASSQQQQSGILGTANFASSPLHFPSSRTVRFGCELSPIAYPSLTTTCTSSSLSFSGTDVVQPDKTALLTQELGVKVIVTWPSQTRQRKLKTDLEPLGKSLLHGTWKDIARAAFRVKELRAEMLKLFLKEVAKECTGIVSRKKPSLLRKTSAADMKELSFQKACFELKERSPLFYSVLMTAAIPSGGRKGNAEVEKWLSSVAVAGSVLLKQRCQNMNAVQLMITTLIKYTGFHTMCNFLSALRIGVSPSYYNKKADEWGQLYNERLLEQKQEDLVALKASLPDAEGAEDGNQCVPSQPAIDEPMSISTQNNTHGKETPNVPAGEISAISSAEITESVILNVEATDCSVVGQQGLNVNNNASKTVGAGWKIAFDNIDIFQRVRDMTQDNQNKDYHWVNHVKVTEVAVFAG
ncbi:uncharacterized protein LOC114948148 isoform X1 [Acropora millepora]|uniref:uncharacterized protein LOC114948148 isoform X1 n=1 Tax=Acropora millepora TaxID=45264 RepID=UPI001CF5A69F|nr:uncharacterized protein LOC114948148 isoform X1 [Acropora millepora]